MDSNDFITKDSGQRLTFDSGMVRDTNAGKTLWHLVASGPMLRRWANLLTRGAVKYSPNNWMKASGQAELDRFRESAFRHFMQWYNGETDEDHAAAVFFNINGAEYVKDSTPPPPIEKAPDKSPAPEKNYDGIYHAPSGHTMWSIRGQDLRVKFANKEWEASTLELSFAKSQIDSGEWVKVRCEERYDGVWKIPDATTEQSWKISNGVITYRGSDGGEFPSSIPPQEVKKFIDSGGWVRVSE